LEALYQLELVALSKYQIATYQTTLQTDISQLEAAGFAKNDVYYASAPPWKPTEVVNQYGHVMTDVITAWMLEEGQHDVMIAIIDSGIDINHYEFEGRISPLSYNTARDTLGLDEVMDDIGHGTMVAGVIGAIKGNGRGIAGITQHTTLLVIKANNDGENAFRDSSIIEGIYYAVEQGADVINISLGGPSNNSLTASAITYALEQNVPVVCASGNDGSDVLVYPAAFPSSLAISAVNEQALLAEFSNYGSHIDLSAPGDEIITTVMNNGTATVSGTSFAAPYVTGIIALLISYDPGITYDEMITRLFQTAQDYGDIGYDQEYGHGIVHAYDVLSVPFHQVSFVTEAPDDVSPVWVKTGNAISLLPHPEYPEHVFKGWYVDPENQVSFEPETIILDDITLYAKYSENYHLIHLFDGNDLLETITIEHERILEIPVWEKAECVFVGWYLDPDFLTPYEVGPIESDLTLYAKYEAIVYHDITVYLMGVVYDVQTFREGVTPHLDPVIYFGYDFEGYYLDEGFDVVYDFEPIMADVVVYARIVPKQFTITLVINSDESLQISAPFQGIPEFPEVTDETKEFAGWYYDASFVTPYLFEPITNHLTLFAKFMEGVHRLDIIIDSDHSYVLYVESGTAFALEDPEIPGWVFTGWFVDQARTSLFSEITITEDWTLYAGFEMQTFEVTFYAEDLITIIHREAVNYHEDVIAPTPPLKASTPAFDFIFRQWSEDLIGIESDLDVYPLYDYTFKPESVRLIPAVDTYGVGQVRAIPGVELLDSLLSVETMGTVDYLEVGRYAIEYHIMYQDVKVYELRRIIHLVDMPITVEIHLNPGITTLKLGEVYVECGAISSQGNVEIIGDVNTEVAGVYVIPYRVTFEEETYEKKRYVYVYDDADTSQSVYYYDRKDDEYEI
jgi:uncharacterized repeat protein (TIGR02543 family)